MQIQRFEFNLFGENTYVIWDAATKEAAVVDPGMADKNEVDTLLGFISSHGLSVKYILLTHGHIDHTFGVEAIKEAFPDARLLGHKADLPLAMTRTQQAQMFRLPVAPGALDFDGFVEDGTRLELGPEVIDVIATPGHSPGGVCYHMPSSDMLLTGDTLFAGSIGRVDLPGGNGAALLRSIRTRLLTLPPETVVFPGHGPATTLAREEQSNPFLQ